MGEAMTDLVTRTDLFTQRAGAGELFSQRIFDDLRKWNYQVALNGTEHTHKDFMRNIQFSEDSTSLTIRYQPDGVMSFGNRPCKSAYVEAKRSKTIERNAYENYYRLHDTGAIVFVVFGVTNITFDIVFCRIEDLKFEPLPYTSKWPISDGWFYPRLHPNWEQIRKTFPGSGTPFRYIDQKYLLPWQLFKSFINKLG